MPSHLVDVVIEWPPSWTIRRSKFAKDDDQPKKSLGEVKGWLRQTFPKEGFLGNSFGVVNGFAYSGNLWFCSRIIRSLRWSICVLVCFGWLLDDMIYLKLGREKLLCKAEQIHKMTTIFTQNDNFVHRGQFLASFWELCFT